MLGNTGRSSKLSVGWGEPARGSSIHEVFLVFRASAPSSFTFMGKRQLEFRCPDCGSRLEADPRTGKVISHGKEKKLEDLTDAASRMEKRKEEHQHAFTSGLDAEKRRGQELDDLFKKASEQVDDDGDKPDNPMEDKWR